jgi:hypothetical protein
MPGAEGYSTDVPVRWLEVGVWGVGCGVRSVGCGVWGLRVEGWDGKVEIETGVEFKGVEIRALGESVEVRALRCNVYV